MEKPSLNDVNIVPTDEVLEMQLGETYPTFKELINTLPEKDMTHEWRYYNDGKAWLCKVQYKKKTVFWLSAWEKYFKTTFYFTEKCFEDFDKLPVNEDYKRQLSESGSFGKLHPLTFVFGDRDQLQDFFIIVDFKKKL